MCFCLDQLHSSLSIWMLESGMLYFLFYSYWNNCLLHCSKCALSIFPKSHQLLVSVVMSLSLILASLLPYSLHQPSSALPRFGPDLTAVGMFAICIEVSVPGIVYSLGHKAVWPECCSHTQESHGL